MYPIPGLLQLYLPSREKRFSLLSTQFYYLSSQRQPSPHHMGNKDTNVILEGTGMYSSRSVTSQQQQR